MAYDLSNLLKSYKSEVNHEVQNKVDELIELVKDYKDDIGRSINNTVLIRIANRNINDSLETSKHRLSCNSGKIPYTGFASVLE